MATKPDKDQMNLELEIPEKVPKMTKGYYLPEKLIQDIKDTAEEAEESENTILTAIINFYYKRND